MQAFAPLFAPKNLIFYYTGNGSATFDPRLTTSRSTTVYWRTSDGQQATTTGTTHDFSYTPASGGPYVCTVRVAGGLGLVSQIDCNTDAVTSIRNLEKMSACTRLTAHGNTVMVFDLSRRPQNCINIYLNTNSLVSGSISMLHPESADVNIAGCPLITGSLAEIPATVKWFYVFGDILITPASIGHLVAIRDIRIYSMGWTAQQNTDVLLSAWAARADYTYASNIALRISAPTGTAGTEPPEAGVSNADWSWNAETSRHDPLTGYAAISDLQTDFYSEGFKPWVVNIT